jgi:hypothetical protein
LVVVLEQETQQHLVLMVPVVVELVLFMIEII